MASRGDSSLRCVGFSLRWLLLLRRTGSRHAGFSSCGLRALECRLSSCGARAYLLHSMWDLPGPGLEPVSPALAGGLVTAASPGKPSTFFLVSYSATDQQVFSVLLYQMMFCVCSTFFSGKSSRIFGYLPNSFSSFNMSSFL